MIKRTLSLLLILCFFAFDSVAQGDLSGSYSSNYSGINSVRKNPASMHHQKVWLSYNVGSGNLFFHNDLFYMDKSEFKLTNLFDRAFVLPMHPTGYGNEQRSFYSYDREENTQLETSAYLLGPSLMLSYNQHAFAISTALRMHSNVLNISPEMSNIMAYGFEYYMPSMLQQFELNDFKAAAMAWSEIGFSYAYRFNSRSSDDWSIGVSIKRLYGAGGAFLNVPHSEYTITDYGIVDISNQQAETGASFPQVLKIDELNRKKLTSGRGWGLDIGLSYQSLLEDLPNLKAKKPCEQAVIDYKYRIAVSLIDIGAIRFKNNAQTHDFTTFSGGVGNGNFNVVNTSTLDGFFQELSNRFYTDPNASLVDSKMQIYLPSTLNILMDYNLEKANLYVSGSVLYGIQIPGAALKRMSQISFAPRYETSFLEFSMPLSIYQFKYPHIGLYARVGAIGIGSDWLSSLIGNRDFNGMDFYFNIKLQLKKGDCRHGSSFNESCGGNSKRFRWSF